MLFSVEHERFLRSGAAAGLESDVFLGSGQQSAAGSSPLLRANLCDPSVPIQREDAL